MECSIKTIWQSDKKNNNYFFHKPSNLFGGFNFYCYLCIKKNKANTVMLVIVQ